MAAAAVLALCGALLSATAAEAATDGPVLWYPMDETTGSTLHNAAAGGAAATLVNGAAAGGAQGVALDGVDDHIDLPDNVLAGLTSVSVSMDVWIDPAQATPYFLYGLGVSSAGGYLFTTGDAYRTGITASDYRGEQNTTKGSALPRGTWKTITYTLDDATDTATLYEDGRQVARNTAVTLTPASIGGGVTTANYIGRSLYAADRYLKGRVRDFRLYDRVLTTAELTAVELRGARDQLALPEAVATDLTLPGTVGDGIAVTWLSDNPQVIDATGKVTLGEQAGRAVLTATLTKNGQTLTRSFTVATVARPDVVAALAHTYVIAPVVASGTSAPAVPAGLSLELASDDPAVRTSGATITASGDRVVTATITATVRDGSATVLTKVFTVSVLPEAQARYVLSYHRAPLPEARAYSTNMSYSGHLALGAIPTAFTPLNENYGIVFPKAVPTANVDINEIRTLRDPYVFRQADGTFGVVASRTLSSGADDSSGTSSMLYFTSADLRLFTEAGLVDLGTTGGVNRPQVTWDSAAKKYQVRWADDTGIARWTTFGSLTDATSRGTAGLWFGALDQAPATTITGAYPTNVVPVDKATASGLETRFGRITNTGVTVPDLTVPQGTPANLGPANLSYSDGSTARRAVDWDAVDTSKPGAYTVQGTVKQTDYPFPFIDDRADPTIFRYQGKYLFIATNELSGAQLLIRQADTIAGLRTAADHVLVGTDVADIKGCMWAPELHEFNGTLHVFFAPCVGANAWSSVQAHVLRLEPGGDPTKASDWETPQRVLKADGSPLQLDAAHPGISLDMTYISDGGKSYVAWSQRYIVGSLIGDAEIWIARIDPANPYRLTSEPRKIITAEYGWDKNGAAVAEGPFVIEHDGKLWMTYSGSSVGPTYVTGLVSATAGADLTDPKAWTKYNYPVLKTDTALNMWGPGHNSFSADEDGVPLVVFHAKLGIGGSRDVAVRRVHFAADGLPVLDMAKDEEVAPANRSVTATVTVEPSPLTITAAARCVGPNAYVAVTAVNNGTAAVDVALSTPYGSKAFSGIAPGKQAYQSFNARTTRIPAGTASAGGQQAPYSAISCG
ncbi:family 43 glycosylhydrolase [Actinoplanes sp. NPDC000266]